MEKIYSKKVLNTKIVQNKVVRFRKGKRYLKSEIKI